MDAKVIKVQDLPEAANICQQMLKEVWKSKDVSVAYVEMQGGSVSLLHKHANFTELYYILSGRGKIFIDGEEFEVDANMLIEIAPGVSHKLKNTGVLVLKHLVVSTPAFNPDDVEVL